MATPTSRGIGTGTAQVLNADRSYNEGIKANERLRAEFQKRQAAAAKDKNDRSAALQKMSTLDSVDIFHRDQGMFKEEAKKIHDYVHQNIDDLQNGNADATLEFQRMKADYFTLAKQSKNTRDFYEGVANDLINNPDKYDGQLVDYLADFSDDENAGNFDFDLEQVRLAPISLEDDFRAGILPRARAIAQDNATRGFSVDPNTNRVTNVFRAEMTREGANEMLVEHYQNSEKVQHQAEREFAKLSPEEQSQIGTAEDYYVNRFIDETARKRVERTTSGGNGGGLSQAKHDEAMRIKEIIYNIQNPESPNHAASLSILKGQRVNGKVIHDVQFVKESDDEAKRHIKLIYESPEGAIPGTNEAIVEIDPVTGGFYPLFEMLTRMSTIENMTIEDLEKVPDYKPGTGVSLGFSKEDLAPATTKYGF